MVKNKANILEKVLEKCQKLEFLGKNLGNSFWHPIIIVYKAYALHCWWVGLHVMLLQVVLGRSKNRHFCIGFCWWSQLIREFAGKYFCSNRKNLKLWAKWLSRWENHFATTFSLDSLPPNKLIFLPEWRVKSLHDTQPVFVGTGKIVGDSAHAPTGTGTVIRHTSLELAHTAKVLRDKIMVLTATVQVFRYSLVMLKPLVFTYGAQSSARRHLGMRIAHSAMLPDNLLGVLATIFALPII